MKQLLIDGNSMFYRCFYATMNGPRMTGNGMPTGAVYSFVNLLKRAIQITKPDRIVIAFDKGKSTWRHKAYKEYKQGRRETPEDLKLQRPILKEFLDAANIQYVESDEFEADDLVGSIAVQSGEESIILTSDRDLLQLSNDKITIYLMKTGLSDYLTATPQAIREKYGLEPCQFPDYKGLCGDSSDNIKGVQGIGDKTAVKLLTDYGSLEGVYYHIDEIKGALKKKLEDHRMEAFFSKNLGQISTNAPVSIEDRKYDLGSEKVMDFYRKYEMKSLIF